MNNNITIRKYQEGDEEEIVELLDLAFDGWPNFDLECTPLEHWQWKYRDNPQKKIIASVAESKGRIVGCQHLIPFTLKIGERIVLGFQGTDAAVHSDFRGAGIYQKLLETNFRFAQKIGINFRYTFILNTRIKAIRDLKRREYSILPLKTILYVKIEDTDQFLKTNKPKNPQLKKIGIYLSKLNNKMRNFLSKPKKKYSKKPRDYDIIETKEFDQRIIPFWNQISDYYSLIIERNKEYLNWRYCDPRGGEYRILTAEKEKRILGYIVLRIKEKRELQNLTDSKGYFVDLLTLPSQSQVIGALIDSAIQYFDKNSVNLIQTLTINKHPYEKKIRKFEFLDSKTEIITFYKSPDEKINLKDFKSPEKAQIQYGDTDWI